jgi:hypothetical protein
MTPGRIPQGYPVTMPTSLTLELIVSVPHLLKTANPLQISTQPGPTLERHRQSLRYICPIGCTTIWFDVQPE